MTTFIPLARFLERLERAKSDSEAAFFADLLLLGEFALKMAVLSIVAAIDDEAERYRYQQYHRLVRADGLGDWAGVATAVTTGPPATHIIAAAQSEARALTQRAAPGDWQHTCVTDLSDALRVFVPDLPAPPHKIQGFRWFHDFAHLRNKTRGHGAPAARHIAAAIPTLQHSIEGFIVNFPAFQRDWAYLHRSLSGKYRVTPLHAPADAFRYLARSASESYPNGVYIFLDSPRRVELIDTDVDLTDIFIANGGFGNSRYELLSYTTGNATVADASAFLSPAGDLPASQTQGLGVLDVVDNCFTNLPAKPDNYIRRPELEAKLRGLLLEDRRPIITLSGRGGIGKTSLALTVLHELATANRFQVILWFSARDIELLTEGPKPVRPHVLSERDIAEEFARLIEPAEAKGKGFKATDFLARYLTDSPVGPLLVVLDNFETVRSPIDTFVWLDTHVRSPNTILITTRFRDFKGDYPQDVHGMNEDEFTELVSHTAEILGVTALIDDRFRNELYSESEGHPYVAKVLLGEVAKAGKRVKVERIVAHRDDILPALFERTFAALTPVAQRVFLTLCRWRSTIPLIGLEAVLLRPDNERMDVDGAVEELVRSSMIERREVTDDGQVVLSVPLVASVFGSRKLETSIFKAAVESDMRFLHAFGASQPSAAMFGVEPRIRRLFESVAGQIASGRMAFEEVQPVLEYVASRYAPGWMYLADLYEDEGSVSSLSRASDSIRRFLEAAGDQIAGQRYEAWNRLVTLARRRGEALEEVHALAEVARLPDVPFDILSLAANRMNAHFAQHQLALDSDAKSFMIRTVIGAMERRVAEATATDLSRLAWLHLNMQDESKARHYARMGLDLDPDNEYCGKLAQRLGMYW